jgi:hypothetical protein
MSVMASGGGHQTGMGIAAAASRKGTQRSGDLGAKNLFECRGSSAKKKKEPKSNSVSSPYIPASLDTTQNTQNTQYMQDKGIQKSDSLGIGQPQSVRKSPRLHSNRSESQYLDTPSCSDLNTQFNAFSESPHSELSLVQFHGTPMAQKKFTLSQVKHVYI